MHPNKMAIAVACGAVLALGACAGGKKAEIDALTKERDAARMALATAQTALTMTRTSPASRASG